MSAPSGSFNLKNEFDRILEAAQAGIPASVAPAAVPQLSQPPMPPPMRPSQKPSMRSLLRLNSKRFTSLMNSWSM